MVSTVANIFIRCAGTKELLCRINQVRHSNCSLYYIILYLVFVNNNNNATDTVEIEIEMETQDQYCQYQYPLDVR